MAHIILFLVANRPGRLFYVYHKNFLISKSKFTFLSEDNSKNFCIRMGVCCTNCCIRKMVFPWKWIFLKWSLFCTLFSREIFREEMWCRICFYVALWPARCFFFLSKSTLSTVSTFSKLSTSQPNLQTFILLNIQL